MKVHPVPWFRWEKLAPEDQAWFTALPPRVQAVARRFPPGRYRMKPGAPYVFTAEGAVVELFSYKNDGRICVTVVESSPAADFEFSMAKQRAPAHAKIRSMASPVGISAEVAPQWLALIAVAPAIADAWETA